LCQSGRLPTINHRRLSASISNQRPRSSYSVSSATNDDLSNSNKNTNNVELNNESIIKCDTNSVDAINHTSANLKASSSSLLIRKDSIKEVKDNETLTNVNSSNKNEQIPCTDKQMWKNTLNSLLDSSNLPNQGLKLNFTQRADMINFNLEQNPPNFTSKTKPQLPQRMLDVERTRVVETTFKSKNVNNISEQLFKESFYDLPSPPIELLNVKEVCSQDDDIEIKISTTTTTTTTSTSTNSTPSLARKLSLNNSMQSPSLEGHQNRFVGPVLLTKPTFKRTQSSEREQCSNFIETNSNQNQIIGKDLLRRVSNRLSNGNFIAESSTTDKGEKSQLISNELSVLLERQKKKIEDSEAAKNRSVNNSELNITSSKMATNSPTLAKKPPPPPRTDRSLQSRRNGHEGNEIRNIN
jgi:hypothetical protein